MSELSEMIIPAGLVLLGAWTVKKYFDTWSPDTWSPINKTCIGPICWSQYGPPLASVEPSQQPGGDIVDPGFDNPVQRIDCTKVSPLLWWVHPECWQTSAGSIGW